MQQRISIMCFGMIEDKSIRFGEFLLQRCAGKFFSHLVREVGPFYEIQQHHTIRDTPDMG